MLSALRFLGPGLSVAAGLAMGLKQQERNSNVYLMLGDGEEEIKFGEQQFFSPHELANLIMIIDLNYMQVEGDVRDVAAIDPVDDKFNFGWQTLVMTDIILTKSLRVLRPLKKHHSTDTIIANTIPGKGFLFYRGQRAIIWCCQKKLPEALNWLEERVD